MADLSFKIVLFVLCLAASRRKIVNLYSAEDTVKYINASFTLNEDDG